MQNDYVPHNLLVTGGAGFIGANFVCYMLQRYADLNIVNLDKLTYASDLSRLQCVASEPHYHFVKGDINKHTLVTKLLRDFNIDTIVHFAAESHVDQSIQQPHTFIETNVLGTHNLLHCAKNFWIDEKCFTAQQCRFHHVSTDEVYGSLQEDCAPFTESHPYSPNSPYSASKASSDHLVRAYLNTYGLPVTISNCSNNYGHGQHEEKFIPTIIHACLKQEPIPVYGNGSNIRDWLYVDEHSTAIDMILRCGQVGQTYNIGGNNEQSNLQTVYAICQLFDEIMPQCRPHKRLITLVEDRPGHDWRYAVDIKKINTQLGWYPKQSFIPSLRNTIVFYQEKFKH